MMIRKVVKGNRVLFSACLKVRYIRDAIFFKLNKRYALRRRFKNFDLDSPKTLSEKIMHLSLDSKIDLKTRLADKYEMHEYLKSIGLDFLSVRVLKKYNLVDEIKFEDLPRQFVLKCTHGSGYNILCRDKSKFDFEGAKKSLSKWLKQNFAYIEAESQYEMIPKRIICEEYLSEIASDDIIDYKVHCMNGEVEFIQCCSGRKNELKRTCYDLNWNKLDINKFKENSIDFEKPTNFSEIMRLSKILSKDFKFVRLDFYDLESRLILGEFTFTPMAGKLQSFFTKEFDVEYGKKLKI